MAEYKKELADEEPGQKFAAVHRVVRHLLAEILTDRVEHLALVTHLRNEGLIDSTKLEEARREASEALRPIIEKLRKDAETPEEPEVDRLLEMLLKFQGPVQ
jgi:formamidopyrimidine-DNA glycosylase